MWQVNLWYFKPLGRELYRFGSPWWLWGVTNELHKVAICWDTTWNRFIRLSLHLPIALNMTNCDQVFQTEWSSASWVWWPWWHGPQNQKSSYCHLFNPAVGDLHGRDGPDSVGGVETLGLPVREPSCGENTYVETWNIHPSMHPCILGHDMTFHSMYYSTVQYRYVYCIPGAWQWWYFPMVFFCFFSDRPWFTWSRRISIPVSWWHLQILPFVFPFK